MCEFSSPQIPITDIENAMERIGSPVRELRRLDAGDDSEVLLCNGLFVIKIPKRPSVRVTQQREFAVYSFLKQYDLPALIPEVIFQCSEFNVMSFIPGENFGFQEYALLSEKEKKRLLQIWRYFCGDCMVYRCRFQRNRSVKSSKINAKDIWKTKNSCLKCSKTENS